MQDAHQSMFNERTPNDGHRKQTLDPNHNFVGLGLYLDEHQFRYYEEYIDCYLKFLEYPKGALSPSQDFTVSFKPLDKSLYPYSVIIFYEPFSQPMSARKINSLGSYPDYTDTTQPLPPGPMTLRASRRRIGWKSP